MLTFGLRPADSTIPIDSPGSLITQANGVNPTVTPQSIGTLPTPSIDVMNGALDVFYATKKVSVVYMIVDTSGSMGQDNKLQNLVIGAKQFIAVSNCHNFFRTILTILVGKTEHGKPR